MTIEVSTTSATDYINYVNGNTVPASITLSTEYPGFWTSGYSGAVNSQWFRTRAYPPNGIMPVVKFVGQSNPTVTLTLSGANSIVVGTSDTAAGTTGRVPRIMSIFCTVTVKSCTPSTALASGAVTATNNIADLPGGTYVLQAYDSNQGLYSTTNTVTIKYPIEYVPITIANLQSPVVPAHFQQLIKCTSSAYSANINSNWNNVEFASGNYIGGTGNTVLNAWVENNAINTAPSTYVWVNLPSGLGAAGGGSIRSRFT